jgi:hypothetical protein
MFLAWLEPLELMMVPLLSYMAVHQQFTDYVVPWRLLVEEEIQKIEFERETGL